MKLKQDLESTGRDKDMNFIQYNSICKTEHQNYINIILLR